MRSGSFGLNAGGHREHGESPEGGVASSAVVDQGGIPGESGSSSEKRRENSPVPTQELHNEIQRDAQTDSEEDELFDPQTVAHTGESEAVEEGADDPGLMGEHEEDGPERKSENGGPDQVVDQCGRRFGGFARAHQDGPASEQKGRGKARPVRAPKRCYCSTKIPCRGVTRGVKK